MALLYSAYSDCIVTSVFKFYHIDTAPIGWYRYGWRYTAPIGWYRYGWRYTLQLQLVGIGTDGGIQLQLVGIGTDGGIQLQLVGIGTDGAVLSIIGIVWTYRNNFTLDFCVQNVRKT